MKAICIYHSADLDGHCSGAIVRRALGRVASLRLVPWTHGDPLPVFEIGPDTSVVVVGLCFERGVMEDWHRRTRGNLVWIDHHASAIEEMFGLDYAGRRDVRKAACELAWEFYFPDEPMPTGVRLLGRYDVWDHAHASMVLSFQYGMRARVTDPVELDADEVWEAIFEEKPMDLQMIEQDGLTVLRYIERANVLDAKMGAFECELDGLPAVAMTRVKGGSKVFESVYDPAVHKLMITAYFNGRAWIYSLYTTHEDVDCAAIARRHSGLGGGHHRAAGFEAPEFLLR